MADGRGEEGWVDGDNPICVILKFAMTTNNLIEYILLNKKNASSCSHFNRSFTSNFP